MSETLKQDIGQPLWSETAGYHHGPGKACNFGNRVSSVFHELNTVICLTLLASNGNLTRAAEFQGLIKANSNGGSQECLKKDFFDFKGSWGFHCCLRVPRSCSINQVSRDFLIFTLSPLA